MTFILLSAGIGRSVKTKGTQSLISFGSESVLEYQIKTIRSVYPSSDIIVVIGFQHEKILKRFIGSNVRFVVNHNFSTTNQSYSLKLGLNSSVASDIKIIHGDIIFDNIAISGIGNHVVVCNAKNKKKIGVCYNESKVTNLSYGVENQWGQIFGISKDKYNDFKKLVNSINSGKCTFEILNMFLSSNEMVVHKTQKVIEVDKKYEDSDYI